MTSPSNCRVTVVVTQRDRLSLMRDSLASLFECTNQPFDLVVVTGGIRGELRSWIEREAQQRGFLHVDAGRPLTPAEARNIGVAKSSTEYIAFVENDIVYTKGWLDELVRCADETGAHVVAPLTCEGRPLHTIVHHVGPVETNRETFVGEAGELDYEEEFYQQGANISDINHLLVRRRTQYVEMHCFLTRRSLFDRIGVFDPDIVSKEYLDFCWRVRNAGESIWVEPDSIITFLVPSASDPVRGEDVPYFLLRWSRQWQRRSHDALRVKWGLKEDGYIARRRALADWRLVDHLTKPLLARVPLLGRRWGFVRRASWPALQVLIALSSWFAWRYVRSRQAAQEPEAAHEAR